VRTLAVHADAEPALSAHPERMRALLVNGKLPGGVVEATVGHRRGLRAGRQRRLSLPQQAQAAEQQDGHGSPPASDGRRPPA
jgi:hypothetical protein